MLCHGKVRATFRRITVTTGAVTAAAVLTATAASAATSPAKTDSTEGAKATCSFHTWGEEIHDDHAQISCDLKDTKGDDKAVYVEWWQDGFGPVLLYNHNGNGSTKHVTDARENYDGSFGTLYFRVCRDVPWWKDNCSKPTQKWKIP